MPWQRRHRRPERPLAMMAGTIVVIATVVVVRFYDRIWDFLVQIVN